MTADPVVTELTPEIPEIPEIPVIESTPDDELRPFKVAYTLHGERVEELFQARVRGPFSIFWRLDDLQRAQATNVPETINAAVERLLRVALPEVDADRLLRLITGDADEVGQITARAIGGVVDFIRSIYYTAGPTRPGSRNGRQRTGSTSSVAKSAKKSASTRSPRSKG